MHANSRWNNSCYLEPGEGPSACALGARSRPSQREPPPVLCRRQREPCAPPGGLAVAARALHAMQDNAARSTRLRHMISGSPICMAPLRRSLLHTLQLGQASIRKCVAEAHAKASGLAACTPCIAADCVSTPCCSTEKMCHVQFCTNGPQGHRDAAGNAAGPLQGCRSSF